MNLLSLVKFMVLKLNAINELNDINAILMYKT